MTTSDIISNKTIKTVFEVRYFITIFLIFLPLEMRR